MALSQEDQRLANQIRQNGDFMNLTYEQAVKADAQNGNQYSIGGQQINYDVPIIPGAWLTKLTARLNLNVNYTPNATTPNASLTAAGIYAVLQNIEVRFGNKQIEVHPYIMKTLAEIRGYNRTNTNNTLGQQNSDIQALLATSPTLNSGDNTWKIDIDIPLNILHPMSVNGLLPISGTGTRVQVFLTPASQFVGKDPLYNVVDSNGTFSVSGTVDCIAWYRDWQSTTTRNPLGPDLTQLSTVQIIKPQQLNPMTAGTPMFKRITNPYPFVKLISVVIDGQQSGKFVSDANNIQLYEVDKAENTSSLFYKYDATNGGIQNYYKRVREQYGQDFDSGVLFFDATGSNTANASNQDGGAYLDLTASGYPAARLGFQLGAVSSANQITPRVETWGVILNPLGIQAV